jgi:hypothetical protein
MPGVFLVVLPGLSDTGYTSLLRNCFDCYSPVFWGTGIDNIHLLGRPFADGLQAATVDLFFFRQIANDTFCPFLRKSKIEFFAATGIGMPFN